MKALVRFSDTPGDFGMIDGAMALEEGKLVNIDEEKVCYETKRLGVRLVQRSGIGNTQWGRKIEIPE